MRRLILSLIASGLLSLCANAQPTLESHGNWARIVANGKPMLMLGGEFDNSSASTLDDVKCIFPHLKAMGLNTVFQTL